MARVKYYDSTTQTWKYADMALQTGIHVGTTAPTNEAMLWVDTASNQIDDFPLTDVKDGDGNSLIASGTTYAVSETPTNKLKSVSGGGAGITSSSTDTEYPSAKCVYDELQNIPSMPSGTNTGDILVWDGTAWVARQHGTLPAGYRQTQYIEFTGTEYVDTGVKISDIVDIRLDVTFTDLTVMGNNGVNEGDNQNASMINYRPGTPNLISFAYKSNNGGYWAAYDKIGPAIDSADTIYQIFYSLRYAAVYFGTTKYTPNFPMVQSFVGNQTYYIGAGNGTGTPQMPAKEKVYILTFYNYRSERIADFVPCVREADNKAGLYDVVGEQFHAIQIIE